MALSLKCLTTPAFTPTPKRRASPSAVAHCRATGSKLCSSILFSSVRSPDTSRCVVVQQSLAGAAPTSPEVTAPAPTQWFQTTITLPQHPRGCHVITRRVYEALPQLAGYEVGLANIFILHTSASLTINENASPDVPLDLNDALNRLAPEGGHYRHADEGPDDMPAHVKSSLMGPSLTLPVARGRFALGTWQGIYLNEHRNMGGPRSLVVTVQGQLRADGRMYAPAWQR